MQKLKHWKEIEEDGVEKLLFTTVLPNFPQAIDFVNKVAGLAEMADHHPDIIVEYTKVTFKLHTHDTGGITERDYALARQIESFAE